jgi:uncharacterized protein
MNDNDNEREVARFIRAQTLKLRLAHLESLLADDDTGEAIETKALPPDALDGYAVKQVDLQAGAVTGWASAWARDLANDEIAPGAYAKTLRAARAFAETHNSQALFPLLWQHQRDEPIGFIADAQEDGKGLYCFFWINPAIERGRQALAGLQNGSLSFSIGFKPVAYSWKGKTRILQEIKLSEVSVVTFPAQLEARAEVA